MKKKYLKFCNYTSKACGTFAIAALLLSILVIVELVFERYFFQRAITWQTELVTMLLVASTFIGPDDLLMRFGKLKFDINGGSEKTFWDVFKKPSPTIKESEILSCDSSPPILFKTPKESPVASPCPVGIVANCIL